MLKRLKALTSLTLILLQPQLALANSAQDSTQHTTISTKQSSFDGWSIIVPAFVVHGTEPGGEAASAMPRKVDSGGRMVLTPGLGIEYKALNSFDFLIGFLKDCYDNPAGTFQLGQHWKLTNRIDWGYTLGLYVRETPITCYTTTSSATSQSAALLFGPGGAGGRGTGSPPNAGGITSSVCLFSDNLPLRYTFKGFGTYIDVVPTPFLNLSVNLIRSRVNMDLKVMSNFYLNEVGLAFSF